MRVKPRPADELQLTPLIDVAFLMLIFFMSLPFKTLDAKLQAQLPADGPRVTLDPPRETVKIRVRKVGDAYTYTLGQHVAPTADGLKPVFRALGPTYAYEIDATPAVPWQGVVDAVNALLSVACTEVRFRGGPPLTPELRRR
jgi:biopolymer transport protein ExbD